MKKFIILFLMILPMIVLFISCEEWSKSVDPLIDAVEDERLTDAGQIDFITTGVLARFATTHDNQMIIASGLSDELFFDSDVPNATFPTYEDIDVGEIQFDNNSVDAAFTPLGELRFLADDLVRRMGEIDAPADQKTYSFFVGYFIGGVARAWYASYWGLNPTEGGGVIDNGDFIPSAQMYDLAIDKLEESLNYADDYQTRVVNSVIARCYLYKGDYPSAATHVQNGLVEGDEPFQSLHSVESPNTFWTFAGPLRAQYVVDFRYKQYVDDDPNEANRIPLDEEEGNSGKIYYRQGKYRTEGAPINLISWQENHLMKAELDLRGHNAGIDALSAVNAVRASHGIDPLGSIDMAGIALEREKELFVTGNRLVDERRFGQWHLGAGKWQYLPFTASERNNNPNF